MPETEGGSNAPASESVTTTECSSLEVVELRAKVAGLEHEVLGLRAQHLEAEEAAKEDRDRARLAEVRMQSQGAGSVARAGACGRCGGGGVQGQGSSNTDASNGLAAVRACVASRGRWRLCVCVYSRRRQT